jgi:uncharacterized repeat protein (TIGR02543 family)
MKLRRKIMKKTLLGLLFFFIFTSFMTLHAQWAVTFGGAGTESALCVQQTSDGGYILGGYTSSSGAGSYDFWILKLDADFQYEWEVTYGGTLSDQAYSIQETSDGGYIVAGETVSYGPANGNMWIMKLDSVGNRVWQRYYGGVNHDTACSIRETSDGGFIVGGYTDSFGAGDYDALVLKLNSDGSLNWHKTYGGTGREYCRSIRETGDGGYIMTGLTSSSGAGGDDVWVVKFSSSGAIDWQKTYGGINADEGWDIRETSDGGYILAAETQSWGGGGYDVWILKLDSAGVPIWQWIFGDTGGDRARSVVETSDDGYVVAGFTDSYGAGVDDTWILKLDITGALQWQITHGGSSGEVIECIQETSEGGFIASGYTGSHGAGVADMLLLKLYPDGSIYGVCGLTETSTAVPAITSVSDAASSGAAQDVLTGYQTNETGYAPTATYVGADIWCEAPKVDLTTAANPSNGGTIDPAPGTCSYYINSEVEVTASAYSGYTFSGWSGDASGTTNPIDITMDDNKSVTANFTEIPDDDGDGDGNGGGLCFIATAAYGSPEHFQVRILREFRDEYLMSGRLGRGFVKLYYKYSPQLARFIENYSVLKIPVRIHLLPIVALSYMILHAGPVPTAVMLFLMFAIPVFSARFKKGPHLNI